MSRRKDFTGNPTELFITKPENLRADSNLYGIKEAEESGAAQDPIEAEPPRTIPKGYMLARARKDARLQLLIPKDINNDLAALASVRGISKNELINIILNEYLEREGY